MALGLRKTVSAGARPHAAPVQRSAACATDAVPRPSHRLQASCNAAAVACSTPAAGLAVALPRRRPQAARRGRSRALAVAPLAMINVDFASPSLALGAMLIGCGVVLLQMRTVQRKISRDADIVVAAMISIVGSTMIFQARYFTALFFISRACCALLLAAMRQGNRATWGR